MMFFIYLSVVGWVWKFQYLHGVQGVASSNPATPTIYTEPTGYISQGVTRFLLHAPVSFSADRVFKEFTNLY